MAAVLADSADQCDALRRARDASARDLDQFEATQTRAGRTPASSTPTSRRSRDADEYDARRRAGAGLTRPELAVLLAGAKRSVKAAVLASDLPDDPATRELLVAVLPDALSDRFGDVLDRHRLRRELIASELTNEMVDHLGPVFASRLADRDRAVARRRGPRLLGGPLGGRRVGALAGDGRHRAPRPRPDAAADRADPGEVVAELLEALTRHELLEGDGPLGDRIAGVGPVFRRLAEALPKLDRPEAARARRGPGRAAARERHQSRGRPPAGGARPSS